MLRRGGRSLHCGLGYFSPVHPGGRIIHVCQRVNTIAPCSILSISPHIHFHSSSVRRWKTDTYGLNIFLSRFGSIGEAPQDLADYLQFLGVVVSLGAGFSRISSFCVLLEKLVSPPQPFIAPTASF